MKLSAPVGSLAILGAAVTTCTGRLGSAGGPPTAGAGNTGSNPTAETK
jgi:hypothetical protein